MRHPGMVHMAAAKDPLILSFSPRGEGTLELAPGRILASPRPNGERDRVRGDFARNRTDLV